MNKIILLLFFITGSIFAQEETVFSGDIEHGGYGGPELKLTKLDNSLNLLVGGKGGWIINHTFGIGGAGYGLVTDVEPGINTYTDLRLAFGYGGINFEYINSSNRIIHFTVSALFGGGGLAWYDREDIFSGNNNHRQTYASDFFFVFEPGATVEVNIVKWLRINLGVSYRMISGAESNLNSFSTFGYPQTKSLVDKDLSGISGNLTFKFGVF